MFDELINQSDTELKNSRHKSNVRHINRNIDSMQIHSETHRRVYMSANKPLGDGHEVKIETLVLNDGRRAERHTMIDEDGKEIVEIFAEEKRPLKLEKRIVREMKNVISKEVHQVVKDGEVAFEEVYSQEPEVPLQVRSRIGVADHAKVVDGDYVRKDEIGKLIEDGIVAGVSALMEQMEPITSQAHKSETKVLRAQEVVEKNVEEKKKNDLVINLVMGFIVIIQLAFFLAYMFLM